MKRFSIVIIAIVFALGLSLSGMAEAENPSEINHQDMDHGTLEVSHGEVNHQDMDHGTLEVSHGKTNYQDSSSDHDVHYGYSAAKTAPVAASEKQEITVSVKKLQTILSAQQLQQLLTPEQLEQLSSTQN